jgi:hypothetical protein
MAVLTFSDGPDMSGEAHGKEGVNGSSPLEGFWFSACLSQRVRARPIVAGSGGKRGVRKGALSHRRIESCGQRRTASVAAAIVDGRKTTPTESMATAQNPSIRIAAANPSQSTRSSAGLIGDALHFPGGRAAGSSARWSGRLGRASASRCAPLVEPGLSATA